MSGNCKVRTQPGQYKCRSCLELVLDLLELNEVLKIRSIHNGYQIYLNDSTERYELNQRNMDYIYIKKYHEKILPRYAEVHAIHSLTSKGFKLVKRDKLNDRYILTLEKRDGSYLPGRVERYKITVLSQENIILVDGGIMPRDKCLLYANNYIKDIGKLESFTPYNAVLVRNLIENTPSYKRVPIGDKKKSSLVTNICH